MSDGIGWGAKETKSKLQSVDAQFNRKYKVKLNKIKLAQKRLDAMVKSGGGQILSLEKYDKQVTEKLNNLAISCSGQTYEQNLDAKLEFINFKISLLTSDSAKTDLEVEKSKASAAQRAELEEVQKFSEKLIDAYNNASSSDESKSAEVKSKALEDKKKELENEIETSSKYEVRDQNDKEALQRGLPLRVDEKATKKEKDKAKKLLDKAYEQVKAGVEAASNLAQQQAKKTLALCQKSIELPDAELANELARKAEKALQQAAAKLSKLPDDVVKTFKQIESFLQSLITGFGDLNFMAIDGTVDLEAMVDSMLASLQSLLDPVFNTATALSLPLPPIVAPLQQLITMIPQMGKDPPGITPEQKAQIEKFKKMNVQIPDDWKTSLNKMKDSLFTVMTTFPLCLIQLIFNMIDALVGQILALGGAMPFPLNLLPLAITLMPKLLTLQMQLPQILHAIIEKKIKDMVAQAMALGASAGSAIAGVFEPTPQCPEAVKAALTEKMAAAKKAKEEQRLLKLAEQQKKKEEELNKKLEAKAAVDAAFKSSPEYKKQQEDNAKKAKMLAAIEASKPQTVDEKEMQENAKLCSEIIKEASIVKTNNSADRAE